MAFGFTYLILAHQVNSGFPPFYRKLFPSNRFFGTRKSLEQSDYWAVIMKVHNKHFLLMAAFGIMAFSGVGKVYILFLPSTFATGAISIWIGLIIRREIRQGCNGPRPWVLNYFTIKLANRWPMAFFDLWCAGIPSLFIAIAFVSFSVPR